MTDRRLEAPPHSCTDNAVLVSTYRPRRRNGMLGKQRGRWRCEVCGYRFTACDCHGPERHPWVGKASGNWAYS